MLCAALTVSIAFAAHFAAGLRCKCGAHSVQALPNDQGGNSTLLPLPVTEIPLAECNGLSFCLPGNRGYCSYKMVGSPEDLGYTVTFGCLSLQRARELCQWGRKKEHECCRYDGCNEHMEFGKRMERDRCWCQNARCKAITCEGNPQQGEHSCFTQVKLKRHADGSKYIKVKRGCTANCKAYSTAEVVQQCCNSTLCNTGPLNITHDNRTIISVEQLSKKNDSTGQFVNISVVAKIFSDIPTFPTTTSAAPTTSGKDIRTDLNFSTVGVISASPLNQTSTRPTDTSSATNTHPSFILLICCAVLITFISFVF